MNLKAQHKLTIGLTGGILCGKSTALAAWKQQGAFVLSCDELVREISIRPAVQKKILDAFGFTDKEKLATCIFTQDKARKKLENILHPLVFKEIKKRLQASCAAVRVVEVPLLFEVNIQDAFDLTAAVVAPEKVLSARAKKRGMKKTDFINRYQTQLSQMQKAAYADICLVNDGSVENLTRKVRSLHRALHTILNNK